jgi:GPH family glycoside/pentoside/hexuronide:cation symporter
MIGINFAMILFISYVTKYGTDVLLIAPAAMSVIFGLGRLWDAITDPLVGSWSDRTRHALGRRRPWLAASALPLAVFTLMCWAPPRALEGSWLVAWMLVAVLGFNTATTMYLVPHQALGAELAVDYHARTRIFAARQLATTVGLVLSLVGGTSLLASAEDPRATAFWLALAMAAACVLAIAATTPFLREGEGRSERGGVSLLAGARDVWRNPHARRLYAMVFIEHMGGGASMVVAPFLMHYVVGMPTMIGFIFAFYTGSTFLAIPLWARLSARIGKRNTWLCGMAVGMTGYVMLFQVGHGDLWWMCMVVCLTGPASACGNVLGSSLVADVIDADELATGERKEGIYYSLYTFLFKTSSALMAMFTGVALSWAGFVPNAEQTELAKFAMRALNALAPLSCIAIGFAMLLRFGLTESEHARIRDALAARKAGAASA